MQPQIQLPGYASSAKDHTFSAAVTAKRKVCVTTTTLNTARRLLQRQKSKEGGICAARGHGNLIPGSRGCCVLPLRTAILVGMHVSEDLVCRPDQTGF